MFQDKILMAYNIEKSHVELNKINKYISIISNIYFLFLFKRVFSGEGQGRQTLFILNAHFLFSNLACRTYSVSNELHYSIIGASHPP